MKTTPLTTEERQLWITVFSAAYTSHAGSVGYAGEAAFQAVWRLRDALRAATLKANGLGVGTTEPADDMALDAMRVSP
jgi:hypothetical protein